MGSPVRWKSDPNGEFEFDSPDSKMLEGTSGGWIMILSALKTLLEGGRLVADQ